MTETNFEATPPKKHRSRVGTVFHLLGSPPYFYALAGKLVPWAGGLSALFFAYSLYAGLVIAPTDYEQGESFRIIYVHVPSAWLSMLVYAILAACGAVSLIWRMKLLTVFSVV